MPKLTHALIAASALAQPASMAQEAIGPEVDREAILETLHQQTQVHELSQYARCVFDYERQHVGDQVIELAVARILEISDKVAAELERLPDDASLEDKLLKVHQVIRENFKTRVLSSGFAEQIARGEGDCDSTSLLIHEVLHANGIESEPISVIPFNGSIGHMFLRIKDDNKVITLESQATAERHQILFSSELAVTQLVYSQAHNPNGLDGNFPLYVMSPERIRAMAIADRLTQGAPDNSQRLFEAALKSQGLEQIPLDRSLRELMVQYAETLPPDSIESIELQDYIERWDHISEQLSGDFPEMPMIVIWNSGHQARVNVMMEEGQEMLDRFATSVNRTAEGQIDYFCSKQRRFFLDNGVPCRVIRLPSDNQGPIKVPKVAFICDESLRRLELKFSRLKSIDVVNSSEGMTLSLELKGEEAPMLFPLGNRREN